VPDNKSKLMIIVEDRRIPRGIVLVWFGLGFFWGGAVASLVKMKQKPSPSSFGLNVETFPTIWCHQLVDSGKYGFKKNPLPC
jgi:hypothetical protein